MADLKQKTVVVTGASRGIGAAAARHLATQGAHVVLAARSGGEIERIAQEIRASGGAASAMTCDVSKADEVSRLLKDAHGQTGRLDVLVNNAGVVDPIARLDDSDPEAWVHAAAINYFGVYYGLRFALPLMLEQSSGGTIINISSGAAVSALEGWSHYCSSKAAALMLTMAADKEYRDKGIRVLGLSPGTVATEMQVQIKASGINPVSQLDPNVHIPPEWVAQAIAYLCGSEADAYLGMDFKLRDSENRRAVGLPTGG